jgi:hypothetical protein
MTKTLIAVEDAFISVIEKKKIYGKGEADKAMALRGGRSLRPFVHKNGNQIRCR